MVGTGVSILERAPFIRLLTAPIRTSTPWSFTAWDKTRCITCIAEGITVVSQRISTGTSTSINISMDAVIRLLGLQDQSRWWYVWPRRLSAPLRTNVISRRAPQPMAEPRSKSRTWSSRMPTRPAPAPPTALLSSALQTTCRPRSSSLQTTALPRTTPGSFTSRFRCLSRTGRAMLPGTASPLTPAPPALARSLWRRAARTRHT